MNIFFLDPDPRLCAEAHVDSHCSKMIIEYAQLMSTAHRELDGDDDADELGLYKRTHVNHPSAVWVRSSADHYNWLYVLWSHLSSVYTERYGRTHATYAKLHNALGVMPVDLEEVIGWTDPPKAMQGKYQALSSLDAYRTYYSIDKANLHRWKIPTHRPNWIDDYAQKE